MYFNSRPPAVSLSVPAAAADVSPEEAGAVPACRLLPQMCPRKKPGLFRRFRRGLQSLPDLRAFQTRHILPQCQIQQVLPVYRKLRKHWASVRRRIPQDILPSELHSRSVRQEHALLYLSFSGDFRCYTVSFRSFLFSQMPSFTAVRVSRRRIHYTWSAGVCIPERDLFYAECRSLYTGEGFIICEVKDYIYRRGISMSALARRAVRNSASVLFWWSV